MAFPNLSFFLADKIPLQKMTQPKIENMAKIESAFHQSSEMQPYNYYKPISKI